MHFVRDTDNDLVNLDVVATLHERTARGVPRRVRGCPRCAEEAILGRRLAS